jgi:hypothetical protein
MFAYVVFMRRQHPGGDLSHNFAYVLPIIVPFVSFVFDRAEHYSSARLLAWFVDAAVVVTAILRMIGDVPFVSGHALFLTYAIARPGSRLTQITAALVMVQVVFLKYFAWHDMVTPTAGIALGLLAAFIVRRRRPPDAAALKPLPNN